MTHTITQSNRNISGLNHGGQTTFRGCVDVTVKDSKFQHHLGVPFEKAFAEIIRTNGYGGRCVVIDGGCRNVTFDGGLCALQSDDAVSIQAGAVGTKFNRWLIGPGIGANQKGGRTEADVIFTRSVFAGAEYRLPPKVIGTPEKPVKVIYRECVFVGMTAPCELIYAEVYLERCWIAQNPRCIQRPFIATAEGLKFFSSGGCTLNGLIAWNSGLVGKPGYTSTNPTGDHSQRVLGEALNLSRITQPEALAIIDQSGPIEQDEITKWTKWYATKGVKGEW